MVWNSLLILNREFICQIQGKDPNEGYQTETVDDDKLPTPNFENLQLIVDEITSINDIMRKRKIGSFLIADNVKSNQPNCYRVSICVSWLRSLIKQRA